METQIVDTEASLEVDNFTGEIVNKFSALRVTPWLTLCTMLYPPSPKIEENAIQAITRPGGRRPWPTSLPTSSSSSSDLPIYLLVPTPPTPIYRALYS